MVCQKPADIDDGQTIAVQVSPSGELLISLLLLSLCSMPGSINLGAALCSRPF